MQVIPQRHLEFVLQVFEQHVTHASREPMVSNRLQEMQQTILVQLSATPVPCFEHHG